MLAIDTYHAVNNFPSFNQKWVPAVRSYTTEIDDIVELYIVTTQYEQINNLILTLLTPNRMEKCSYTPSTTTVSQTLIYECFLPPYVGLTLARTAVIVSRQCKVPRVYLPCLPQTIPAACMALHSLQLQAARKLLLRTEKSRTLQLWEKITNGCRWDVRAKWVKHKYHVKCNSYLWNSFPGNNQLE